MVIVAGTVDVKADKREEAIQAALKMAKATQSEAGCITYKFYADLEKPTTFFVFEAWETEAALAQHFQTPHMAEFQQILPHLLAGQTTVKRYNIESVTDL